MKVKELIEKLNKCNQDAEIGIEDLDEVYKIEGLKIVLYGNNGIENFMYTISATETEEVTSISNSIVENIDNNYLTTLMSQNREYIEFIKECRAYFKMEYGECCWLKNIDTLLDKTKGAE